MNFLVLGGRNFIRRQGVTAALANGRDVTLFDRGITNPELFPRLAAKFS
jgi:2'-hydroxyisoflavone reductase